MSNWDSLGRMATLVGVLGLASYVAFAWYGSGGPRPLFEQGIVEPVPERDRAAAAWNTQSDREDALAETRRLEFAANAVKAAEEADADRKAREAEAAAKVQESRFLKRYGPLPDPSEFRRATAQEMLELKVGTSGPGLNKYARTKLNHFGVVLSATDDIGGHFIAVAVEHSDAGGCTVTFRQSLGRVFAANVYAEELTTFQRIWPNNDTGRKRHDLLEALVKLWRLGSGEKHVVTYADKVMAVLNQRMGADERPEAASEHSAQEEEVTLARPSLMERMRARRAAREAARAAEEEAAPEAEKAKQNAAAFKEALAIVLEAPDGAIIWGRSDDHDRILRRAHGSEKVLGYLIENWTLQDLGDDGDAYGAIKPYERLVAGDRLDSETWSMTGMTGIWIFLKGDKVTYLFNPRGLAGDHDESHRVLKLMRGEEVLWKRE